MISTLQTPPQSPFLQPSAANLLDGRTWNIVPPAEAFVSHARAARASPNETDTVDQERSDTKVDEPVGPPVIDLSASEEKLIAQVRAACERWGFFQITGHGVNDELRERFEKTMRAYFSLPTEEKLKSQRSADNARGYVAMLSEMTKQKIDNKECFDVGNARDWAAPDDAAVNQGLNGVNRFPDEEVMPGFRTTIVEYFKEMERLSERVGELMALGMGADRDYFKRAMKNEHTSHLRLNHYPELEDADSALGVGAHTDSGFLTVLAQDEKVHTLQVKDRNTDEWVPVAPHPGAYTINTGDLCVIFSNGLFHAPEHRVLGSAQERFSAPYFYNPSYSTEIAPVPTLLSAEEPSQFWPMQWGYFRAMRVMGNFGDFGEYVKADMWRMRDDGQKPKQVVRQEKFISTADYSAPFDIEVYAEQIKNLV